MGTSTMGSDLHSDKQDKTLKLQARKKELELLLAAKNEELYKLCVQEVQLTGVMPPEAPLSPDVPRERLGSVKSVSKSSEGDDVRDGTTDNTSRRLRQVDRLHESELNLRKNLTHRLSTPSISGISTKSAPMRHMRRPETSANFYPSPPQDGQRSQDTFSMHVSQTYPALAGRHEGVSIDNAHAESQPNLMHQYRQHTTTTTEYMNKIYYTTNPEAHAVTRFRETHFSSSHPDIATHSQQQVISSSNCLQNTPLLYQYASHLKAQNQHLGGLNQQHVPPKRRPEGMRRNTLQRTRTYHSTSHTDYNPHLESLADAYRSQAFLKREPPSDRIHVPNTLPLRERNIPRNLHMQLQVSTEDYTKDPRHYPDMMSPVSQMSGYSQSNFDSVSMKFSPVSQSEGKMKEKQWYETSLDSPTKSEAPVKKISHLKRTSSVGNSQAYEIMMSSGRNTMLQSPNLPLSPTQPMGSPVLSPNVSQDSQSNLTVIEQGKCIPYREETKPFEMSDFYKYSTKFRQANAPKPVPNLKAGYNKLPMDLPQYANQECWQGH